MVLSEHFERFLFILVRLFGFIVAFIVIKVSVFLLFLIWLILVAPRIPIHTLYITLASYQIMYFMILSTSEYNIPTVPILFDVIIDQNILQLCFKASNAQAMPL